MKKNLSLFYEEKFIMKNNRKNLSLIMGENFIAPDFLFILGRKFYHEI